MSQELFLEEIRKKDFNEGQTVSESDIHGTAAPSQTS